MNTVPCTVMRNGPASMSQRAWGLGTTLTSALPSAIDTRAPWLSTEARRPFDPGASLMTVPSTNRKAGSASSLLRIAPSGSSAPSSMR